MTLFDDTLSRRTPQLEEQRQAFLEESEASGRKE
jgi:hypothetical protein